MTFFNHLLKSMGIPPTKDNNFLTLAFIICGIFYVIPIWSVPFLPIVDFPQHAAQITIMKFFNDPEFGFVDKFRINWGTPYWVGMFLGRLFAIVLPSIAALKMVLSVVVFALPLSLFYLIRRTGGDPWWAFLGFPLAYGHLFFMGFISYMVAIPLGVLFIAHVIDYSRFPTRKRGWGLLLMGIFLFFSHVIVFSLIGLISGLIILTSSNRKNFLKKLAPLYPLGLILIIWAKNFGTGSIETSEVFEFDNASLGRGMELLSSLIYFAGDQKARWMMILFLGLILLAVSFKKIRRSQVIIFLCFLCLYLFLPYHFSYVSDFYHRFGFFVFLALILSVSALRQSPRVQFVRVALIICVLSWSTHLVHRFKSFSMEMKGFGSIVDTIPQNKKVLGLTINSGNYFMVHFPAYYQAIKGGELAFSFAYWKNSVVKHKDSVSPFTFTAALTLKENHSINEKRLNNFDYFIVRSKEDPTNQLEKSKLKGIKLVSQDHLWWLYEKLDKLITST